MVGALYILPSELYRLLLAFINPRHQFCCTYRRLHLFICCDALFCLLDNLQPKKTFVGVNTEAFLLRANWRYNDSVICVKIQFDINWICVYPDFDAKHFSKEILIFLCGLGPQ